MAAKIIRIGSCLSLSTMLAFRELSDISIDEKELAHHGSYILNKWLDGESPGLDAAEAHDLKTKLGVLSDRRAISGAFQLDQNMEQRRRDILEEIKNADLLVFDSNYEVRPLFALGDEGRLLSVTGQTAAALGIRGDRHVPELEQVPTSLARFFANCLEVSPKLRVLMMNYPHSGFARTPAYEGRKDLSETISAGFLPAIQAASPSNFERVHFIDETVLRKDEHSSKGTHYFTDSIYDGLAAILSRILSGSETRTYITQIPRKATLNRVSSLSNAESSGDGSSPYSNLPERNYWRRSVAQRFPMAITSLYDPRFPISPVDKVATSGSCFAQHIGRRLAHSGFGYMDAEPAPKELSPEEAVAEGYNIYSARYGNIYTPRQLLQLIQRATGSLVHDEVWKRADGQFVDPLRPTLKVAGFDTADEVRIERKRHLEAVGEMFAELDVIVFTMGLTECWRDRASGIVYPVCPGTSAGGRFDPALHEFCNFSFGELRSDMTEVLVELRKVNPNARMLLTVSPVPLVATAENRHVLVSTVASKSVLRAIADDMTRHETGVDYFPSYEIVTGSPFRSMFFAPDLREVQPEGVDFIMSHFFDAHGAGAVLQSETEEAELVCDEMLLEENST